MAMTADSSTNHHSPRGGSGSDGVNTPHVPSKLLPSPWVKVVRGELDSVPPASKPQSPPPRQSDSPSGPAPVPEQSSPSPPSPAEDLHALTGSSEPEAHIGNAAPSRPKKQAWSKPPPSEGATAVTSDAGPLIGDDVSWPELSKAARLVPKAVSAESSSKAVPEGSSSNSQASAAPVTSLSKRNAHSSNNKQNPMAPARHRQNKQRGSGGLRPHPPPVQPIPPPHPPVQPILAPHPPVQPILAPHPPVQPIPPPHPPVQPIPPPRSLVQPIPPPHPSVLPIPPASPPPFPIIPVPPNAYPNLLPPHVGPAIREPRAGWEGRPVGGFPSQPRAVNDHRISSWRGSFVPNGRGEGQRDRGDYGSGRDANAQSHRANSRSYVRSPAPADSPSAFIHPPASRPIFRVPYTGSDMGHLYYPSVPMGPFRGGMIYPNGPPLPMFIPAADPLPISLVYQIEYYFSDDNLAKDEFLKSNMDNEGWVPISLIAKFPRVKGMTGGDHQLILNCLKVSKLIEVQDEKVRRRDEWMKWVRVPALSSVVSSPTLAESSQNALATSILETSVVEPAANSSCAIPQEDHAGLSKGYSESSQS